jgi:hypothetical protein
MGALAIDSNGRLWAGTGEANPGGGSITFGGTGVYTSDDGGATWKKRGLDDSGNTGRIAVDPSNPDRIFVAAAGSLFNPGGERGIYRSENGGASWKRVLAPETPFAGGADLAIDPTNPNRIFAAMWITGASPICGRTAASAPASSGRTTVATRGRGSRTPSRTAPETSPA